MVSTVEPTQGDHGAAEWKKSLVFLALKGKKKIG